MVLVANIHLLGQAEERAVIGKRRIIASNVDGRVLVARCWLLRCKCKTEAEVYMGEGIIERLQERGVDRSFLPL